MKNEIKKKSLKEKKNARFFFVVLPKQNKNTNKIQIEFSHVVHLIIVKKFVGGALIKSVIFSQFHRFS